MSRKRDNFIKPRDVPEQIRKCPIIKTIGHTYRIKKDQFKVSTIRCFLGSKVRSSAPARRGYDDFFSDYTFYDSSGNVIKEVYGLNCGHGTMLSDVITEYDVEGTVLVRALQCARKWSWLSNCYIIDIFHDIYVFIIK